MQGLFGAGFHGEGESGNFITIKSRSSSNHDQEEEEEEMSGPLLAKFNINDAK